MSQVIIAGDTSGTITLQAPAVSGSTTLTLPAATGTVMVSGNMPLFSAYMSANQTITSGTLTTIQFNSTQYDTASSFVTGSYYFRPNVAGYYLINSFFGFTANPSGDLWFIIYKNGSYYASLCELNPTVSANFGGFPASSIIVYLNGSTDYVDLRMKNYAASSVTLQGGSIPGAGTENCYFQGFLARTA